MTFPITEGSGEKPCEVCGQATELCCADCCINDPDAPERAVCTSPSCRDEHERRAQCTPPGSPR